MWRMGLYSTVRSAMQDIVAPALLELRGGLEALQADIRRVEAKTDALQAHVDTRFGSLQSQVDTKLDSLQAQMGSMRNEILAEIRRLDARIDGVDRELRAAIDIRERLAALEARRS